MSPKNPDQPAEPAQPAAEPVAEPVSEPAATSEAAPAEAPKKNRLAWLTSPKVAAATIITVLALGSLGGAFALGRATAGDDHRDGPGFTVRFNDDGRGGPGFGGPGGFGGQRMQPPGLNGTDEQQSPATPESGSTDSQAG